MILCQKIFALPANYIRLFKIPSTFNTLEYRGFADVLIKKFILHTACAKRFREQILKMHECKSNELISQPLRITWIGLI